MKKYITIFIIASLSGIICGILAQFNYPMIAFPFGIIGFVLMITSLSEWIAD